MRPTNLRTLMESSATTTTRSFSMESTAPAGMLPAATASAPGAKTRAAGEEAAIGRDRGAGEKLYAAEIIAEILDDNFIFAENFFNDDAHLFSGDFHDDHVEIAVQRFEWRQRKLDVEADDLSNYIAYAREELSADVFDFAGLEAANFFDDGQRQSEDGCAAAHEERLRDDQGERHFYGEGRAVAGFGADFNFAVEGVHVGADA